MDKYATPDEEKQALQYCIANAKPAIHRIEHILFRNNNLLRSGKPALSSKDLEGLEREIAFLRMRIARIQQDIRALKEIEGA